MWVQYQKIAAATSKDNASIVSHSINLCITVCIYIYSRDSAPAVGAFVAEETAEPFAFKRRLAAATVAALKAQVPHSISAFSIPVGRDRLWHHTRHSFYASFESMRDFFQATISTKVFLFLDPRLLIACACSDLYCCSLFML